jgi:hypothetical protein
MHHPLNNHLNVEFDEKIGENKICLSLPNKSAVLWAHLQRRLKLDRVTTNFWGFFV